MRTVFLVVREPGLAWLRGKSLREQPDWDAHAGFMDGLFSAGRLLFGGPLPEVPGKIVLVIAADTRERVYEWLAEDPWTQADVLRTASVAAWEWTLEDHTRVAA